MLLFFDLLGKIARTRRLAGGPRFIPLLPTQPRIMPFELDDAILLLTLLIIIILLLDDDNELG